MTLDELRRFSVARAFGAPSSLPAVLGAFGFVQADPIRGWAYRFEAYTPKRKRRWGYYALPLLWRDRIIGWGNVSVAGGACACECGYVTSAPRDRRFTQELRHEIQRMREFLVPRTT